jgi:hypothetical protein
VFKINIPFIFCLIILCASSLENSIPLVPGIGFFATYSAELNLMGDAPGSFSFAEVIPGWTSNIENYTTDDGSLASGGLMNYGESGNNLRSIGSLTTSDFPNITFGFSIENNYTAEVLSVSIQFLLQEWRSGNVPGQLDFQYSLDSHSWIDVPFFWIRRSCWGFNCC